MNIVCIIPTLGRQVLRRAVVSVLAQSIQVRPIIVIDKCASYFSVVELLDGLQVDLIQTNVCGAADLRNLGIEMYRGNIITFLDDDDFWLSTKTEKQICKMQPIQSLGFLSCSAYVIYPKNVVTRPKILISAKKDFRKNWYSFSWLRNKYYAPVASWIFYGNHFEKLYFRDMEIREDLDLLFRIELEHVEQIDTPLVVINTDTGRAAKRETIRAGFLWMLRLSKISRGNTLKFFMGEFLRSYFIRLVK